MKPTVEQPNEVPEGAMYWHGGNDALDPAWFCYCDSGWLFMLPKLHPAYTGKWSATTQAPPITEMRMIERVDDTVVASCIVTGQKFDQGKPMMSLIPPRAEMAVAEVLTFGANKYGPDNWRHVEDLERRYTDAALRHINAYRQLHAHDQESGLPHLAHAICCLMFMLEMDLEKDAPTR